MDQQTHELVTVTVLALSTFVVIAIIRLISAWTDLIRAHEKKIVSTIYIPKERVPAPRTGPE